MKNPSRPVLFIVSLVVFHTAGSQQLAGFYKAKSSDEKARPVMQDNEFERNPDGQQTVIYCNPLLIDGHSLDYGSFSMARCGVLTVVGGLPESVEATPISFRIFLRRNGQFVNDAKMDFYGVRLYEIELSRVLAFGMPGDQLIVDPVNREDWKAKRILKLVD